MRLTGLNWPLTEGRSVIGRGFFAPKNEDGLVAREKARPLNGGCGLETADALGVKELAAGLGLNSIALALNLLEAADIGVCVLPGLEMPD
jgi:hypothetical protein